MSVFFSKARTISLHGMVYDEFDIPRMDSLVDVSSSHRI